MSPKWLEMAWNAKKSRFYGTLIPSDFVDFRSGIGRYRYDGESLTFSAGGIIHLRPLQFRTFADVPIVYRVW